MTQNLILAGLIALLLAGCGYNPEDPVYDTSANPDNFPAPALAILDDVEAGELKSYDAITERFANLYTAHTNLLDNPQWKAVIDRLGVKFRYKAEQALEKQLAGFNEAASFLTLASFALPEDRALQQQARLFRTWMQAVDDTNSVIDMNDDGQNLTVRDKLTLLRHFELSDSLHQRFSLDYLRTSLFAPEAPGASLDPERVVSMHAADQALLLNAGLIDDASIDPLTVFDGETVQLLAARVVLDRPDWYLVELYFEPLQPLAADYTVAVRVYTTEDTLSAPVTGGALNFIPFDFEPPQPSTNWSPGEITSMTKIVYFQGELTELKIGLYERGKGAEGFLGLADSDEMLVRLPLTQLATDE